MGKWIKFFLLNGELANNEYFGQLGAKVTFKTYQEGHSVSLRNLQDFTNWLLQDLEK